MKTINRQSIALVLVGAVLFGSIITQAQGQGVDKRFQALEWRCVGPHVGVRGAGVAVHPTDTNVFFHAHSSGGVWKTDDAGQYWNPISDGQFNVGAMGAIAVSPTNPDIMYVGTGEPQLRDCVSWGDGVYKTTDGGKTWTFVSYNSDITNRPFYYHHLHASPHNGAELWVLSNKLWQSLDDGKTWKQRSGTKDDFHDLAFDPNDPDRMIITHDGGAMVTLSGGKTWSGMFSQPNQQINRVSVDNQFPYNFYGNCQDLIGYKVPSASVYGGIALSEVTVVGSGECGASVPHPTEPDIVYHLAQSTFA